MITEDDLGRFCHSRTLQRAKRIAQSDRDILTKKVSYDTAETSISAFVASSSGWNDRYRSSVTIDEELGEITGFLCTCPAYRESDGLCKHCAALVIAYQENPQSFLGYKPQRTTETSPVIAAFMQQTQREAAVGERASIDLEMDLSYGFEQWTASFKVVGPHGSYVLKDIAEFVEHIHAADCVSYGKKLTFTHSADRFTSHGWSLVQVLERAVLVREHINEDGSTWRSRSHTTVGRTLNLTQAEIIELLDANGTENLTIRCTDYGMRSLSNVSVVEGNPSITIELESTAYHGYAIKRPDGIVVICHGTHAYVWWDETLYRCTADFATGAASFLAGICQTDENRLFVNEDDMALFCATALPAIGDDVHVVLPEQAQIYKPVACNIAFYFDRTKEGVTCKAQAIYGSHTYDLEYTPPKPLRNDVKMITSTPGPLRNKNKEDQATALVAHFFDLPKPFISFDDEEAIGKLLFGGLKLFQALGDVFTTPAFDRLLHDGKPRVTMGLSLAGNLIALDVSADDLEPEDLAGLLASYTARKHFHRLSDNTYVDMADLDLSQLEHLAHDLEITSEQLMSGHVELPAFRAFYLDEELKDATRSKPFLAYVDKLHNIQPNVYKVPSTLQGTLRPYQLEGYRWMRALCDMQLGGILADEMGLGKSIQLIAFLIANVRSSRKTGPSLIVCPASLVYNWTAEIQRFAPSLHAVAVAGTKQERKRLRATPHADVLITSYDLLRIDTKDYQAMEFYCCALDEAQFIKNHATLTTRAVKRINAHHRFALTGTPMENRLSELWSIFDFLMPGFLGSYARFRQDFELDILGNDETVARRLKSLVGPFMLRRLKSDVLVDLPDKLETIVYAPMSSQQHKLYAAHEQNLRTMLGIQKKQKQTENKVEVLAELTKLRQLCCDPGLLYEDYHGGSTKLDTIGELVESAMDSGAKTLVFSQFTTFLSRIAERLDAMEVPYYTITGATPKRKRVQLVDAFNEDDTPVFLISLKAGGTGLNLTGASVVIHADPWWNAAAQDQATDRAHRIGQNNVVSVQKVIASDTIEERIVALQEAKTSLSDQIIGANGVSLASLTRDDLLDLLDNA